MNIVEKAKAQALSRIVKLRQEIETLEQFITHADAASPLLEAEDKAATLPVRPKPPGAAGGPKRLKKVVIRKAPRVSANPPFSQIVDAAIEIVRANGRPMSRRQLYQALEKRGLKVVGQDPLKALGTILWRDRERIKTLDDGRGYWPVGDPISPIVEPEIDSIFS